jgi:hypothetical protein
MAVEGKLNDPNSKNAAAHFNDERSPRKTDIVYPVGVGEVLIQEDGYHPKNGQYADKENYFSAGFQLLAPISHSTATATISPISHWWWPSE